MSDAELIILANEQRKKSYAPYSHFTVGAALVTKSGNVYTGCNIENAAYSPSVCAERVALFKAVSEGESEFLKVAIIGGNEGQEGVFCAPCGVCRQVYSEFVGEDFRFVLGSTSQFGEYTLAELLPYSFTKSNLGKE